MNYITFHPYKEFKIEADVQLVIYDTYNNKIYSKINIKSYEQLKLEHNFFEKHWEYKYKYRIQNSKDAWEDCSKLNRIKPEVINENNLKYLLYEQDDSDILVVVFQAINTTPTYNYISTLHKYKVNKLFIKDDYGQDSRTKSSYYLGRNKDLSIAKATQELIKTTVSNLNINDKHIIFMGSSKGGYAALYHGYQFNSSYIIAGGPQVLLGDYLSSSGAVGIPIFNSIIGDINNENIEWANNLLIKVLQNAIPPYPQTFIHVGLWEPHFHKHVLPFTKMMKENDISGIELNIKDYSTHNELAIHFPDFVQETIDKIIKQLENIKQ